MKAITITLICFLISGIFGYIAFVKAYYGFNTFTGDTLLQMLGTIFAINIGMVPFLHYELNKLEIDLRQIGLFKQAKKEIKQNATVMTTGVILSIFASIIKGFWGNAWVDYVLSSFVLGTLLLIVAILFDTVSGVLAIDSNFSNKE